MFPTDGLAIHTYWSVLTRIDLREVAQSLTEESAVQARQRTYVDLSDVTASNVTFADLLGFVLRAREARAPEELRVAVHAPTALTFGTARMYQQLAEADGKVEVLVARDPVEALGFLNLTELPQMVG